MRSCYHCSLLSFNDAAHFDACEKLGILHRDISNGNILMYPKVRNINRKRALVWRGILADWEVAKDLRAPPKRHQPQRTVRLHSHPTSVSLNVVHILYILQGTWQSMSVALLTDNTKIVEVCDDLESFFYVVLYHAVRYFASNVSNAGDYIEDFFDAYTVYDGVCTAGFAKRYLIKDYSGAVRIRAESGAPRLRFNSPMDLLLAQFHRLFHSLYKVRAHDVKTEDLPPLTSVAAKIPLQTPPRPMPSQRHIDHELSKPGIRLPKVTVHASPITQDDRLNAEAAADHRVVLGILRDAINSHWADTPLARDRVGQDWHECGPNVRSHNRRPRMSKSRPKPLSYVIQAVKNESQAASLKPSKRARA